MPVFHYWRGVNELHVSENQEEEEGGDDDDLEEGAPEEHQWLLYCNLSWPHLAVRKDLFGAMAHIKIFKL